MIQDPDYEHAGILLADLHAETEAVRLIAERLLQDLTGTEENNAIMVLHLFRSLGGLSRGLEEVLELMGRSPWK